MGTVRNLDAPCPLCDGKPVGDHTMREWAEHVDREHTDLPYEAVADGPIRVNLGGADVLIADTIVARATVLQGEGGLVKTLVGCVLVDYQIGKAGGLPVDVARIGLIGPPETLRKAGRLLRDTANGAANAVEQAS